MTTKKKPQEQPKEKAELVFDIARDLCIQGTERMAFVIGKGVPKSEGDTQMIMLVATMTYMMIKVVLDQTKDLEQARLLLDAIKGYSLDMLSIEGFE